MKLFLLLVREKYLVVFYITAYIILHSINANAQCNCRTASTYNPCIGTAYTLTADIGTLDHIAIADNWQVTSSSASYTLSPSSPFDYRYAYLTLNSAGSVSIRVRYAYQVNDNDIRYTSTRTFTALQATLSGTSQVCKNNSYTFSVSIPTSPSNYTYTFPSGCTVSGNNSPYTTTSSSISLLIGTSAVSGNVCVTANATGCSTVNSPCQSITVSSVIPAQPGTISSTVDVKPCPGFGWNLTISPITNATYYTWTRTNPSYFTLGSNGTSADLIVLGSAFSKTTTVTVTACTGCGCSTGRTKNFTSWTQTQCGPLHPGRLTDEIEPSLFPLFDKLNTITV